MDKTNNENKVGRDLTPEEEKEWRDGMALQEMVAGEGWKVVRKWLEDRAYHSWTNPLETNNEKEWMWRELNLFHNAMVAKQLLEDIEKAVAQTDYLSKVRDGTISSRRMRI